VADARDRHVDHDPVVIASLLDRDLDDGERAVAESRVASCQACAGLYADLVALSGATAGLPTPPRPRAFTLTAADAERLSVTAAEEPSVPASRLAGVMTDPHAASHPAHDSMLVASLADHSLAASERAAAEALVAACGLCAALHADLLALRAATQAMPTPVRPRDYTLTAEDAARLRRTGWRRLLGTFGSSRDAFSRPLALGLTTLGLAGLLVATVPSIMSGQATSGGTTNREAVGAPITAADQGAPSGAPAQGAAPLAPAGVESAGDRSVAAAAASARPVAGSSDGFGSILADRPSPVPEPIPGAEAGNGPAKGLAGAPAASPSQELTATTEPNVGHDTANPPQLALVSAAFLVIGLGLFAIRWTARRFRHS
jgi:anti-sigma factor RsiW